MKRLKNIFLMALLMLLSTQLKSAIYTVTTGTDFAVGCLRDAITNANSNPGSTIRIGGTFPGAIQGIMPQITANGTIIDGWYRITSAGDQSKNTAAIGLPSNAVYTMQMQDPGAVATNGLYIKANNCVVQGLVFNGYGGGGAGDICIRIEGNNNKVLGCYFGTNTDGGGIGGCRSEYGIAIVSGDNNQVGDGTPNGLNVISYQHVINIYVGAAATNTKIKGNYIGTTDNVDEYLNGANTNQSYGIYIVDGSTGTVIGGTGNEANVIAFNDIRGIHLEAGTATATIRGNIIYANPSGAVLNSTSATSNSIEINTSNSNRAAPVIVTATTTTISGTANANDIVEVFQNNSGGINCQDMNLYITQATADGAGAWIVGGAFTSGMRIISTGTNSINTQTSEVSNCMTISAPLPIELLFFDARLVYTENPYVITNWATASEINNDFFTVERSQDGNDYDFLSDVKGAGNSTSIINYSDVDYDPLPGLSYYRLKQTDYDGKYQYSNVVAINNNKVKFDFDVLVNKDEMIIAYSSDKEYKMTTTITNIIGQTLYSKEMITGSGGGFIYTNINKATGVYLISVIYNNKHYSKKVFIK